MNRYLLPDVVQKKGEPYTWGAFANFYRSYYRTERARKLSTTMHEIGHNLGLKHAGKDDYNYGDKSGYMGSSAKGEDWPSKCFNAPHHYQLGWFDDRVIELDEEKGTWEGNLVSFVDYPKTKKGDAVIIRIGDMYFLQYNRAKDYNFETSEASKDMVTIAEHEHLKAVSWVNENLSPQRSYDLPESDLRISFCKAVTSADGIDSAHIKIGPYWSVKSKCPRTATKKPTKSPTLKKFLKPAKKPTKHPTFIRTLRPTKKYKKRKKNSKRPTKQPTRKKKTKKPSKRPTKMPTKRPTRRTKRPTKKPTKVRRRRRCLRFRFVIKMDDYPEDISWRLVTVPQNGEKPRVVKRKSDYTVPGKVVREAYCLPANRCYRFLLRDEVGDGICCDSGKGGFSVYNGRKKIMRGRKNFVDIADSVAFGNCKSNK